MLSKNRYPVRKRILVGDLETFPSGKLVQRLRASGGKPVTFFLQCSIAEPRYQTHRSTCLSEEVKGFYFVFPCADISRCAVDRRCAIG